MKRSVIDHDMAPDPRYPKFLVDRVNRLTWPQLLVLEHPNGDPTYYLLASEEDLWNACVEAVKLRLKEHTYEKPDPEPFGLRPELPPEEVEKLPGLYKEQALHTAHANQKLRAEHAEELEEWNTIHRVIAEHDGPSAFLLLFARAKYEGEGVTLLRPVVPEKPLSPGGVRIKLKKDERGHLVRD